MAKILIADDSITVRKVAERLLTEAGMEVALAASGEEALAWLANERPDFIVTDVIMPDKSGYDVCNYVRSQVDLSETPVLLISGIVNEDVTRKAESCRADGVLKKPFQGASLQERVLELLAKRGGKDVSSQEEDRENTFSTMAPAADTPDSVVAHRTAEEDGRFVEPVSEPVTSSAQVSGHSPKSFRITEEQLQTFRLSSGRIKELEAKVEDEKSRADRFSDQVNASKLTERRVRELEAALADHEQRAAEARSKAHEDLEIRNKELESSLSEQKQRVSDLSDQLNRFADVEKQNKGLEATIEDLRSQLLQAERASVITKTSEDGMPRLQALITDQQQRLADLAGQVIRFSEAETKINALETALASEQSRTAEAETKINSMEADLAHARTRTGEAETKVQALEAALANEQNRTADLEQRCADMERASARATMRLDDINKTIAQIGRLATTSVESHDSAPS